jgi:hypothetical protein
MMVVMLMMAMVPVSIAMEGMVAEPMMAMATEPKATKAMITEAKEVGRWGCAEEGKRRRLVSPSPHFSISTSQYRLATFRVHFAGGDHGDAEGDVGVVSNWFL